MGTIYILKNKINGKCYIGQTIRPFNKRFRQHCQSGSYIGRALRKHKVKNFEKILIEDIPDDQLNLLEQEYIIKYNSISPNGYNLTRGGRNGKCSEETKKKMSAAQKGNKKWLGKHHSEKSKQKISKNKKGQTPWMKGKHHTEEARQKLSITHLGNPSPMKDKHHTEEAKQKNRIAHLGNIPTNKGIRTPHPCPICGLQKKEKIVQERFVGYLKTCGNKSCIIKLRNNFSQLSVKI